VRLSTHNGDRLSGGSKGRAVDDLPHGGEQRIAQRGGGWPTEHDRSRI